MIERIEKIEDKSHFYVAVNCNPIRSGEGRYALSTRVYEINEGTGDNLLEEDVEEGYVDYIDYTCYSYKKNEGFVESDGGMVLLHKPYSELSVQEIVESVLDMELDQSILNAATNVVICMNDMPVTKTWKVYGWEGHRQKKSFCDSTMLDCTDKYDGVRILDVANADITGTNDYTLMSITRATGQECSDELDGQISDGYFENVRTGHAVMVSEKGGTRE